MEVGEIGGGKKMSRKILILLLVISILFIAVAISYAYVYRYMFIDSSVTVKARREIDPGLSSFQILQVAEPNLVGRRCSFYPDNAYSSVLNNFGLLKGICDCRTCIQP